MIREYQSYEILEVSSEQLIIQVIYIENILNPCHFKKQLNSYKIFILKHCTYGGGTWLIMELTSAWKAIKLK